MADRFSRDIEIRPREGTDVGDLWDLLETVWGTTLKVSREGRRLDTSWRVQGDTSDNRSFERDSLSELREAFKLNHAVPLVVDLFAFCRDGGIELLALRGWFGKEGRPDFRVGVSGSNRIEVEKLSHDLMESLTTSKDIRRIAPEAEIVHEPLSLQSNDVGASKASNPSPKGSITKTGTKDSKSNKSWLSRRWGDHAITLLITVVGGVVVLVVGAVLELSSGG
ncbi:hypothetical protein [Arthrobacter sp. P2b]|uniref:hypothetical protein n=1 Tax=Arthrobacter sp. P2b TaxID=1938741 RepID=UPI0009A74E7B|nr:hypothetical protein [Arthrobacter sp. P2b]